MQYFAIAVVTLMVVFGLVAIVDLVFFKNKFKLGTEFKKGLELIGPIVLAITGIISFVPAIAWVLNKTITPLYTMMGLDPSMAVTSVLAIDMGGFQLAKEVALDPTIGEWAGVVYGSMMGATIVFLIPVGLSSIKNEDVTCFSKGILFGLSAIPFGTFIGGLMMGINALTLLLNLIIPVIFSIVIILCLTFAPRITTKIFKGFSIFIDGFAVVSLGIAIFKDFVLVPIADLGAFDIANVPFFNMINPTTEGVIIAGNIGLILCGTLPLVYVLNKLLSKPFRRLAGKTSFSELGMTSFLTTTANSMAVFPYMHMMSDREKIVNVAFAVCASWVIGDHLAFAASNAPHLIAPMMVAKLISGIIAIIVALIFTREPKNKVQNTDITCEDAEVKEEENIA